MRRSWTKSVAQLYPDDLYRKKDRHIVIAQMESVVPLHSATLEPRIWGGGTSEYTWGKVQKFFSRHPLARKGLPPGHFFCEYLDEDYAMNATDLFVEIKDYGKKA